VNSLQQSPRSRTQAADVSTTALNQCLSSKRLRAVEIGACWGYVQPMVRLDDLMDSKRSGRPDNRWRRQHFGRLAEQSAILPALRAISRSIDEAKRCKWQKYLYDRPKNRKYANVATTFYSSLTA
jgi:hypothetical protein